MRCLALILVLAWMEVLAAAPFGTSISVQGELRDDGVVANGQYDFEARVFADAAGSTLVAGPITLSGQPVDQGIFGLDLDFGPNVFGGDNRWLELRVRRPAAGNFVLLLPRHRFTPAPYSIRSDSAVVADGAVQAGSVPWTGISDVPADLADGDDDELATMGCADGSVPLRNGGTWTCVAAAVGTVTSVQTGEGLSGGPITATGTIRIAASGVTAELLASNSVSGANVLDGALSIADMDASVQPRITGGCSVGQVVQSVNADGSLACADLPAAGPRSTSHAIDTGASSYVAAALRSDLRPVVFTSTSSAINLFKCGNRACSTRPAIVPIFTSNTTALGALVGGDGVPRLKYQFGDEVRYLHCGDGECTTPMQRVISTGTMYAWVNGMALDANDVPAFVYRNTSTNELNFRRCANPSCSALGPQTLMPGPPHITPSIAYRANGNPVIATASSTNLVFVLCSTPDCTGFATGGSGTNGFFSDVVVPVDDRPVAIALNAGTSTLYLHRCDTPACASVTTRTLFTFTLALNKPSLALAADGRLVFAFGISGRTGWYVGRCSNAACDQHTIVPVPLDFSGDADFVVGADGLPFLAAQRDTTYLNVLKCGTIGCE